MSIRQTLYDRLHAQLTTAILTLSSIVAIGTFVFHRLEDWTWIESLYFSVVTLTTVGYGDLKPTSDTTRLFIIVFIIIGVSVTITALGIIGNTVLRRREAQIVKKVQEEKEKKK